MAAVVVGGGITGLTVAYELRKRGVDASVHEKRPRPGGLIQTESVDGFTIEAGPDSVLAAKPAAVELIRELGLGSALQEVATPGAFVLRGGDLFALPSPSLLGLPLTAEALQRYDLLPPPARERLALEPTIPPRAFPDDGDDESVASFFRRRFGPETVDLIAQPLLGGIHAGDIETLSMRSLFPRLRDLERAHGSVLKGAEQSAAAGKVGSPFVSLRGGMGSLVDALVRTLPEDAVRAGVSIEGVDRMTGGWHLRCQPPKVPATAAALVLAVPARVAAMLLRPIDARAADLCGQVPYVSTASVALAWPRAAIPHPLNGTGFVVARSHSAVRITACTWVSSKWDGRAPEGQALLRAFIGGAHDPEAASLPEDELIDVVRRDLASVLGVTAEPSLARVYRWVNAGAQHTVGHLKRVDEIEQRLAPRGIYVAGSGFRSVGIPDCVADARRVAALIAETAHGLRSGTKPTKNTKYTK